ncbi:MAG TPA: cytochrome c [Thermoanaerobaculia bacterium]|nr:cytochrome c [Thermoanaerobaculia bacterium]
MNRKVLALTAVVMLVVATVPAIAADAAATYKAKCAACHGPDGSGQTAMGKKMQLRDLGSPEVQKQTDKELTALITDGKGKMPAYKDKLSSEEITALVGFIRKMKK